MEGIPTLRDLLSPGDWFVKVYLKDAYFTVPIDPGHHQYLRFMLGKERYQFTCLPFGLSCALRTFTKVMKPVMDPPEVMGSQDYYLYQRYADSGRDFRASISAFRDSAMDTAFPGVCGQWIEFGIHCIARNRILGSGDHLSVNRAQPPRGETAADKREVTKLLSQQLVLARAFSQFIGKLNAATQAVTPAPLFYRHLQGNLKNALASGDQGYESTTFLSQEAQEELIWWQQHLLGWNGRCLLKGRDKVVISSDASLLGWGASCNGAQAGGPWSQQEKLWYINCLEIQAAYLAAQTFLGDQSGVSVLLQLDNTTAVAYINNLWGNSIPTFGQPCKIPMDVGITEGYNADGPTHTWCVQLCGRRRVQDNEGSHRLEAQPHNFQQNQ